MAVVIDKGLPSDAVTALPGSRASAVAWRAGDGLHVTVIAKATFGFAHDAAMARVEPQEILAAEVHWSKNPARSARFTADLAPALQRADVLFTGHAHAIPGSTVISMTTRLAVFDGEKALLDKRIIVQDPVGFTKMPMVYERAYGGVDWPDNPLGIGAGQGTDEPNLVHPILPERTACFGPIGRAWPARRWLLGSTKRKVLEGPIAEIPEGFDWSYFQAAPADQLIDPLRGDEWIVLEGLHPTEPRLRMRLPGARGIARVHGLAAHGVPEGHELALVADTLRVDGDLQRCTLVARASFLVPNEDALGAARIVAGVAIQGEALVWPDPTALPRRTPAALPHTVDGVRAPRPGTVHVDGEPPSSSMVPDGTAELRDDELEIVGYDRTVAMAPGMMRFDAIDDEGDRVTLPIAQRAPVAAEPAMAAPVIDSPAASEPAARPVDRPATGPRNIVVARAVRRRRKR